MIEKRWVLKEQAEKDKVERLSKELNVNSVIANLLVQRGIETYDEARVFFRPELNDLHDPFLMKDMDKAVERLEAAIKNKEKVLIYGDYDVDGTTAVALVYSYLRTFHSQLGFYVPNRYSEGYGVSIQGIDHAAEQEYSLIITLDCGIKANEKVIYAKEKGIDLIICDHHNPGDSLPDAVAVLDPKRKDCDYPYKELSGCGVGFKFMQGYIQKNKLDLTELYKYLDLVVVSIGSDIVPITGENRILAYYGLKTLNDRPCKGLNSIIHISGLQEKEIQINDIVFKLGPRINAAGRMESGSMAVELLISEHDHYADAIGYEINSFNTSRKKLDHDITDEALKMIENDPEKHIKKTNVVYSENWHKGVIGIVASRLTETWYKPTVVLTYSNGVVTGSARSVDGYNLYAAIESCSDLLINFGGHMYAAGLSLKPENVEVFMQRFEEYVSKTITDEQLIPTINIDSELQIKDITPKFYRIL
ncbi:MAG: single-stranded-DNA-specific exonuclease RecJ, partial [Bacteroidales bacterium]|nr:single-stranded-DNA-specific exonuclease RecJ [Bacteroidales bacterium]